MSKSKKRSKQKAQQKLQAQQPEKRSFQVGDISMEELSGLRMLYSSNAPWSKSGYGVQGSSLLPRLAALMGGTHNVGIFAWYGLEGGIHVVDGFVCYPKMRHPYGNDVIGAHAKDFHANLVISLIDVWVMEDTAKKVAPALWCPWLPIDHCPIPEKVLEALEGAHTPLTYSKWGHALLEDAGVPNRYIAHGIEPAQYRVVEDWEESGERADFVSGFFGIEQENPHISCMVAANKGYPDRKAFQVNVRAWWHFAKDKPHAYLYIHTDPTTALGGIDMPALCKNIGIPDERVIFPDRYQYGKGLPWQFMQQMYNSCNVLIGSTMSEGFGIPIIEAQACGLPVIVTDFSAMPELVRWGSVVSPRDMIWTPMNSWQAWPDWEGVAEALEMAHQEWLDAGRTLPLDKRLMHSKLIHDEFGWDQLVATQWYPFLKDIQPDLPPMECPPYIRAKPSSQQGPGQPTEGPGAQMPAEKGKDTV